MILTTTQNIEGRTITEYVSVVSGESFENQAFRGHRSYVPTLSKARMMALNQLEEQASNMGADAVVGINIDFELIDTSSGVLVYASGTAVKTELNKV